MLIFWYNSLPALVKTPEKRVVIVPVTNVMHQPTTLISLQAPIIHKTAVANLYTQALLNEEIIVQENHGAWLKVQLLEQSICSPMGKITYGEGWIAQENTNVVQAFTQPTVIINNHNINVYQQATTTSLALMTLSMGTKLFGIKHKTSWWQILLPDGTQGFVEEKKLYVIKDQKNNTNLRSQIIQAAKNMLGMPFCWFGRSSYNPAHTATLTSIGCDGLTNLAYRACGIDIPRFTASQYHAGKPIDGDQLKPGDLIFFASATGNPHHAMLYIGNDELIEATYQSPGPQYPARIISCQRRLKKPVKTIKNGDLFNNGRYSVLFCKILD